jgi:hypothetical protein
MHSEVLCVLDVHINQLHALRRDLVAARPVDPGERRRIAAAAACRLSGARRGSPSC